MKSAVTNLILFLTGFYCIVAMLLFFTQRYFIFFPRGISKSQEAGLKKFSPYEVNIEHNGFTLHGWFIKKDISSDHSLIIYYGGNAEEVSQNLFDLKKYGDHSLLLMNYRGYGKSTGRPGQATLFSDALFIFDHISKTNNIPSTDIILMGRSLGSGVATYVARQRQVKAVVFITPFDNLVNIGKTHYPIFPVEILLRHPFDSVKIAPEITVPMIAIIAGRDKIIPNELSMNLVEHWGGDSHFVVIKNADHNSISNYPEYWYNIMSFLTEIGERSV